MTNVGKKFIDAVRKGEVPGISIDPDNPALAYEPMDIYARPGKKVRYTGHGGYDYQKAHANKHLKVGATYTVVRTEVGGWHTDVFLAEVPGEAFNSVHFASIP